MTDWGIDTLFVSEGMLLDPVLIRSRVRPTRGEARDNQMQQQQRRKADVRVRAGVMFAPRLPPAQRLTRPSDASCAGCGVGRSGRADGGEAKFIEMAAFRPSRGRGGRHA